MTSKRNIDDIHRTPDVTHIQNPDVSHEMSDVDVKAIASFVAGLFMLIVVTMILMKLLLNFYEQRVAKYENAHPVSKLAAKQLNQQPPEPRLQNAKGWGVKKDNGEFVDLSITDKQFPGPEAERFVLQEQWQEQLAKGGVDPKTGYNVSPIKQAMRDTVSQGLPARTDQGTAIYGPYGETMPSDSNSGRVVSGSSK